MQRKPERLQPDLFIRYHFSTTKSSPFRHELFMNRCAFCARLSGCFHSPCYVTRIACATSSSPIQLIRLNKGIASRPGRSHEHIGRLLAADPPLHSPVMPLGTAPVPQHETVSYPDMSGWGSVDWMAHSRAWQSSDLSWIDPSDVDSRRRSQLYIGVISSSRSKRPR